MRLYLKLSPPTEPIPMNHINVLTGALHKWLGPNKEHDELSLYSFGWLTGSKAIDYRGQKKLIFPDGAEWFISALDGAFLNKSINGILNDPDIRWGMRVQEVTIRVPPPFEHSREERFKCSSPVFIKRKRPDGTEHHYLFSDPESNTLLTETFQYKLDKAGLATEGAAIRFDPGFAYPRSRLIRYEKAGGAYYDYRASACPVLITGTPEQKAFAWKVGVGSGTGLGFGGVV
jgi:CRISPR-associated endoribonuclease Cas6